MFLFCFFIKKWVNWFYCFGLFCEQPAHAVLLWSEMQKHQRATRLNHWEDLATVRRWGNHTDVTNVCHFSFQPCFNTNPPLVSLFPPPGGGFTLESVFLCGEVCVLLVPFAWGQALFSVEVLRVYPNVQDLGVSARLSESGGTKKKRQFISNG